MAELRKSWGVADVILLKQAAGTYSAEEIAHVLETTVASVRAFAQKHGVSLAVKKPRWTRKEDEKIIKGIASGVTARQLATKLNRTERAIYHRADFLRKQKVSE